MTDCEVPALTTNRRKYTTEQKYFLDFGATRNFIIRLSPVVSRISCVCNILCVCDRDRDFVRCTCKSENERGWSDYRLTFILSLELNVYILRNL